MLIIKYHIRLFFSMTEQEAKTETETDTKTKTIYQFLCPRWFQAINEKKKIVEGRLMRNEDNHWIKNLKIGDHIVFEKLSLDKTLPKETIKVLVTNLITYKTFVEMFDKNGLENVLPGVKTNEEGVLVYREWYSEDLEKELGVIGIFIQLV